VNKLSNFVVVGITVLFLPNIASAQQPVGQTSTLRSAAGQQNVPATARQAEQSVENAVRRFGIGVTGGVGIDPEIIDFGVHGTFGPIFKDEVQFRPGLEFGVGEVTTLMNINLDFLYTFENATDTAWSPYVGAGPAFGLSHRGFETEDGDNVSVDGDDLDEDDDRNRFDFSDTDFNGGMNFIVGMRKRNVFFEMKATAWGVSNIRLLAGVNF
jgi:hypothetical protein